MKKTFLYLVILAILGLGVWAYFFREKGSDAPLTADGIHEDAFQVRDTANVGKIFLAKRGGAKITLRRTENGSWWVDNKYPAAQFMIDQMLTTLARQAPVSPVAQNMQDPVVRQLAGSGIKVELYNKKGERFRTMYIGGEAYNYSGTYMLVENAQRPYVVQSPNTTSYVTPHFDPASTEWRDRQVLFTSAAALTKGEVRYADSTQHSFIITQDASGTQQIKSGIAGRTPVAQNLRNFAGAFEKLYVAGYVNGNIGLDSILSDMPKYCTIQTTDKSGRNQVAEVYYFPLTRRSKNLSAPEGSRGINNDYDADNLFAVINGGKDTAIIQRRMFERVLRKASDFYSF